MSSFQKFITTKLMFRYKAELQKILFRREDAFTLRESLWSTMVLGLNVLQMIRLLVAYVDCRTGRQSGWINFDVCYRFLARLQLFDANFALFIILFLFYGLYLNYFLYVSFGKSSPVVLACHRQVDLTNPKAMVEDNRRWFANITKVSRKNATELSRLVWKLLRKDEEVLQSIRFRKPLSMYPMLTKENRVTEFLIYLASEVIISSSMLIYPILHILLLGSFSLIYYKFTDSWLDWAVILETNFGVYLTTHNMFKTSTTQMCIIMTFSLAITFSYGQLNRFVAEFSDKTRKSNVRAEVVNNRLYGFYREHNRMGRVINLVSDHRKTFLSVAILTNIPLNVSAFTALFLSSHRVYVTQMIFTNVFITQCVMGFLSVYPLATNTAAAHRAGRHMVPLQPKITDLRLKLKWDNYHRIVHHSKHTIAYRANFIGRVTVFSIVKFVFFYVEAVIFEYSKRQR